MRKKLKKEITDIGQIIMIKEVKPIIFLDMKKVYKYDSVRNAWINFLQQNNLRTQEECMIDPVWPVIEDWRWELAQYQFMNEEILDDVAEVAYTKNTMSFKEVQERLSSTVHKIDVEYFEQWKSYLENYFDESHYGDCTARANSCSRCRIEKMFGFDSLITSKSEGSYYLSRHDFQYSIFSHALSVTNMKGGIAEFNIRKFLLGDPKIRDKFLEGTLIPWKDDSVSKLEKIKEELTQELIKKGWVTK